MMNRTILTLSATALMSLAMAQSVGRSFDAAVELVPGMTVERNGVIYGGDYTRGLLQNGDIVRTDNGGGAYQILTSDGSVVSLSSNAEVRIVGGNGGYDVFQVSQGSANVSGNAYDGYPVNNYFSGMLTPRRLEAAVNSGTPYINRAANTVVDTPYAHIYNGPPSGVYGYGNLFPPAINTPVINGSILYPWSGTTVVPPMSTWWTRWNTWSSW